jgi:streptomycin 6-kinase
MISIPQAFATATITRAGDVGREWIDALPGMIEELCRRWNVTVDGPVMHGYLGLVIPVRRAEERYVLKVSWIDESSADEALALSVWNGEGTVRLYASQPIPGAMLLEQLDYLHSLNDVEIAEAVKVAGHLLRRLAIPAPSGFRSLKAVSQDLCRSLPQRWKQYGRPLPQRWMEQACELSVQFGASTENLLVNYDLHYADVLSGKRELWLAVDPKVVVGDPEFGIAQLLWCRLEDIESRGGLDYHFRMLIEAAALDPVRTRGWTLVRCVDYWLWGVSVGLTHDPVRCEAILNWLTGSKK